MQNVFTTSSNQKINQYRFVVLSQTFVSLTDKYMKNILA